MRNLKTVFKPLALALVFVTAAFAHEGKIEGKDVVFKNGAAEVKGVLYLPENPKNEKLPALVLIHEWYGLNGWVKQQAEKWAQQGYVTLAVDLYRGKVATGPEMAHELMRGLPEDRAVGDMRAAVAYLKSQANVDGKRIGAMGWCMGGGYALALAQNEPTLKAAVINYGRLSSEEKSLQPVRASILGIFGGKDSGITPDSVRAFEKTMRALKKDVEVHIFEASGHGFQNETNQPGYNAADTAAAWKLQTGFLADRLKKSSVSRGKKKAKRG